MKAIVGRDDDSILGFTMIGDEAGGSKGRDANRDTGETPISDTAGRHSRAPDHGGT